MYIHRDDSTLDMSTYLAVLFRYFWTSLLAPDDDIRTWFFHFVRGAAGNRINIFANPKVQYTIGRYLISKCRLTASVVHGYAYVAILSTVTYVRWIRVYVPTSFPPLV